jgi:hypothetical protein
MKVLAHLSSGGLIVSDDGSELLLVHLRPLNHGSVVFLYGHKHGSCALILTLRVLEVFLARVEGAHHALSVDIQEVALGVITEGALALTV